jgi:hypothetical protein
MNQESSVPAASAVPALRICAEYAQQLARRICEFLPAARNRRRGDKWPTGITWDDVDQMLAMPWAATSFGNAPDSHFAQVPHQIFSPFGDW